MPRWGLVMRPWVEAVRDTYSALAKQGKPLLDLDNSSLATVDKLTFRTPDYQLSTAQDYRKGLPGSQQYVWQATLGPTTLVTTVHPGLTPKYWQGRLPRNAQHRNLLVSIYDVPSERLPGPKTIVPEPMPAAMRSRRPRRRRNRSTRAPWRCFAAPRSTRSAEDKGWTFGRKGQGYVALWSQAPVSWTAQGVFGWRGPGRAGAQEHLDLPDGRARPSTVRSRNGRRASRPPRWWPADGAVKYTAPGLGEVAFAWNGPLTRGRNARSRWPTTAASTTPTPRCPGAKARYEIAHAGHRLVLDFAKDVRQETTPPATARRN